MNNLPLSGVQVIDFGHKIAGPTVGMILADLGATVIKVNAPNSKEKDYDAITNRNKQCITIDLKRYEGLEQAKHLIAKADVIIENFRPGVMANLGLDFKNIVEDNKEIIALSLPGFCSSDDILAHKKATEATILAHTGVFSEMGPNRTLMGIEPSYSSLTMASLYGAVIGASAVVFALQSRENTGYGDYIEVPLCAALTECLLAFNIIKIYGKPERYLDLRNQEVQRRKTEGLAFDLTYDEVFSSKFMDPFYRPYKCKDGRTYYVVSIAHITHATRVMKSLGVYERVVQKIEDNGYSIIEDVYLPKTQWEKQGSFNTYPVSREWSDFINEELEDAFLTKASWEWEKILSDAGAVGGVHRTLHEWMNNEHVRASGLFVDVEDHKLGKVTQPGIIAWADDYADGVTYKSRIETTYEDALASLHELEKSEHHFKRNNIGWLDGVKVLDLSNVIAGPHSGAVLARYGAEVIKIDSSKPTFDPSYILYAFNTGQGKKSALVDIRTEEGYEILSKLIKEVDVVILNAVDKQVKKLKLDRESLQKINPNIIFSQLDLYSSLNEGSMTNTLGYDDIAQAVTGIMTRFGEGLEQPEEHAHLGTIDVMCGFASTLSVAVALYAKNKNNEIIQPRTSLTAAAGILQIPFVIASKDKEPKSKSRNVKGEHAFSMIYVCADKYSIYIDTDLEELSNLRGDFDILEEIDSNEYIDALTTIIKRQSSSYWIDLLNEKDIAISRVNHMRDTRDYNLTAPDGSAKTGFSYSFTRYNNHPSGYAVEMVAPYAIQPKYASIYALSPTEKYGSSTFEILSNLGYSKEVIDTLAEDNVISYQWADEYLPS